MSSDRPDVDHVSYEELAARFRPIFAEIAAGDRKSVV